jgi:hypothetical protein
MSCMTMVDPGLWHQQWAGSRVNQACCLIVCIGDETEADGHGIVAPRYSLGLMT